MDNENLEIIEAFIKTPNIEKLAECCSNYFVWSAYWDIKYFNCQLAEEFENYFNSGSEEITTDALIICTKDWLLSWYDLLQRCWDDIEKSIIEQSYRPYADTPGKALIKFWTEVTNAKIDAINDLCYEFKPNLLKDLRKKDFKIREKIKSGVSIQTDKALKNLIYEYEYKLNNLKKSYESPLNFYENSLKVAAKSKRKGVKKYLTLHMDARQELDECLHKSLHWRKNIKNVTVVKHT